MSFEQQIRDLETRVAALEHQIELQGAWRAIIQLDGFGEQEIYGTGVPQVGSTFSAHKHTTDGGTYANFEVTDHSWE